MLLGPLIRRAYLEKYVPRADGRQKCLLVGVVDPAEAALLEAKGYAVQKADLFPRQHDVIKMDLTRPEPEHEGQYAVVVAFDVLEHIPDDRAAVAGLHRLLSERGRAFIHVPGGSIDAPLDENDLKHGHVRHGYTEQQIKDVVYSLAFGEVQYIKTFNSVEDEACVMAARGDFEGGLARMKDSSYDGTSGRCHMFIAAK